MRHASHGFTLLELTIALVLLALIASVLFGSLRLSADSWDRGEAKTEQSNDMRVAEDFLRRALAGQHPLRLRKIAERPLFFSGASDSLAFVATLPGRTGGGMYFFRVSVVQSGDRSKLVLSRVVPDVNALAPPEFGQDAETSTLADGIASMKLSYFGRDANAAESAVATWRDTWDNAQMLPDLIRIDVTPERGLAWPTLVVAPNVTPEAGCRGWDAVRHVCVAA